MVEENKANKKTHPLAFRIGASFVIARAPISEDDKLDSNNAILFNGLLFSPSGAQAQNNSNQAVHSVIHNKLLHYSHFLEIFVFCG